MADVISRKDIQKIIDCLNKQSSTTITHAEFKYVWPNDDMAVLASKNFCGKHYSIESNRTYINGERVE